MKSHYENNGKVLTASCKRFIWRIGLLGMFFCLTLGSASSQWTQKGPEYDQPASTVTPSALEKIGIDQRLNETVPLDLVFQDEYGQEVRLGDYFGKKPVVLALVYYNCPMLCNQVLDGLTMSLRAVKFDAGTDFDVVAVSFDPRERAHLAIDKRAKYVRWYDRTGTESGWHFLTGNEESIGRLTEAVGFRYSYDSATNQFAHASGIMLLTSDGKLSRYFYGIEYAPRDVQLGLVEASENRIGSAVDQLLLYCYHYDPATGKYGAVVINMVRVGGVLTIGGTIALVLIIRRRRHGRAPDSKTEELSW